MTKHYATLDGIKRAATKLKRRSGMSHSQALEQIAREAGFLNYCGAVQAYAKLTDTRHSGINPPAAFIAPVNIIEMSPELAAALKLQRDLDIAEAGPQAPELSGNYLGIDISSRWDIAQELQAMRRIIDLMPDLVRKQIASIWCDSNAQADYSVTVAPGRWREGIEFDVRDAVRAATSGFNGLLIEGDGNHRMFDPEWEGDDYDYGEDTSGEAVEWNTDSL